MMSPQHFMTSLMISFRFIEIIMCTCLYFQSIIIVIKKCLGINKEAELSTPPPKKLRIKGNMIKIHVRDYSQEMDGENSCAICLVDFK